LVDGKSVQHAIENELAAKRSGDAPVIAWMRVCRRVLRTLWETPTKLNHKDIYKRFKENSDFAKTLMNSPENIEDIVKGMLPIIYNKLRGQ